MTASEVGFDGAVQIFLNSPTAPGFIVDPFKIRFCRGKTEHFKKAQENPNQFFFNKETESLYYINRDKKMFRVEFVEEAAK